MPVAQMPSDSDHLVCASHGVAQVVIVLIGVHCPTGQKHVDLRHVIGRDDQRHIGQPVLIHPLVGIEQRHLAAGAARELQDGK